MCGIAGYLDFNQVADDEAAERLAAMTGTMACRGPDAEGQWRSGPVGLGHRRLAVIDLDGGRQPMAASRDDGSSVITTFSGEVYNHGELRGELRRSGHRFHTQSDTEVLLRAYLQWGPGFVDRLNGMYAFAVWDTRSEELLLVRDRLGIKPLYYHPIPGGLLFGSEPKAILAHPGVERVVDMDGFREMLAAVWTPGHAIFRGMHELRPGHLLLADRDGLRRHRYWALTAGEHTDDLRATIATVHGLLADTVRRQLVADVPVGTLLSGGLDSSAVTALAARESAAHDGRPARSFAVEVAHDERDFHPTSVHSSRDAPFARELARHAGTTHVTLSLGLDELGAPHTRAAVVAAHDTPQGLLGDGYASMYLLFKRVKEHVTVALSGEAADELFGGYAWFHVPALRDADTFPWTAAGMDYQQLLAGLLDQDLLAKLDLDTYRADQYVTALAEVPTPAGVDRAERRLREVSYLHLTRYVPFLLDRKDRMSMAHGLEVRVPFCDHRLVQYVFNTPWSMKTFDGREKSLLRAATRHLLPAAIAERRKSAYPTTHDPGYDRTLRDELAAIVNEPDAPVHPFLDLRGAREISAEQPSRSVSMLRRSALELVVQLNEWLKVNELQLR